MNHAPTISSIISPDYLNTFVQRQYQLDVTTTCSILKIGINHTYRITTKHTKYVLRVYFLDWRTEKEILEELQLLDYLQDNGLAVAVPIADKNKKYLQTITASEGNRYAVLFSYATGETIRNPSKEICYSIGKTMAKFHLLTENKSVHRIDYTSKTLVEEPYKAAIHFFEKDTEAMQYYSKAKDAVITAFKKANTKALRKGVVHLDFWYENMKIKNNTEISIFDFDNCGNGWQFLDISYYLMILFRNEPDKKQYLEKQAAFYKGYESITAISLEEKKHIPLGGLAIWLHYNGIHIARYNDFSNVFLSEEFLKYWMHTVKQWMEFNAIKL